MDTNRKKKDACRMDPLFRIVGSRWNLLIIWYLREGRLRFTELQKRMGNINANTITIHLRELEQCRIIRREVYPEVPPRVEYSLTGHGETLIPLLTSLQNWWQTLPASDSKQE